MPDPGVFLATNFNPATSPVQSVIYDANGMIDEGPIANAAALGYTASATDLYLEQGFASIGYGDLVHDVSAQFPGATYYSTISIGVSANGTTTIYDQHGIRGGKGSEVIFDTGGDDIFVTRGGADLVVSFGGNNAVDAGSGDDIVMLGTGDDVVLGGAGNDWIGTREGADIIDAGNGHDTVEGGAGADTIWGGRGNDRIDAGAGDDWMAGGGGRDTFVFAAGCGAEVIADLEARDWIELAASTGLTDFAAVQGALSQQGQDVVLDLGNGDSVLIEDVALGQLNSGDFIFA
ncbi:calcium-binding protein [Mesobacterium pallidum]|uniref:calcium-binding protein n=1 Tax=Mesobacterium pallidum TaxID=2872037 RepID=UPI001EE232CB|nr:calcium-binding protein [Mesobacterium pallidum]